MDGAPRHEISGLKTGPGELSFEARIAGGEPRRVWFRTDSEVVPNADAALATCVMPAMASGGTLAIEEPVSPRMLRTQREFQAIQRAWSLEWEFGDPPLREVEVVAPTREVGETKPVGRVAAFFSGGVDSFSTLLHNPDVTDLIFVRGIDILPGSPHQEGLADRVEARLREAAGELGLPLHTVETNLRELSDPLVRWEAYYGCAVVAVALFLGPLFDRVMIAGDSDYEVQVKLGANWMVDQLWSTEQLEIVDDGGRFSRMQRIEAIAGHPVVRRTLRVCWHNPDGAYNCGRCRKCLMTMAALEATGSLQAVETFPSEIDLEAFGREGITQQVSLTLWEDLLDRLQEAGKPELEQAVAAMIAQGKKTIGLSPGYRRRKGLAAPPSPTDEENGVLHATPETAQALAEADAVALLVGSYDGSGNYGDICQLDATLGLLDRFSPGLVAVPVLERGYLESDRTGREEMVNPPAHAVFFGPATDRDGLVPLAWPIPARFGLLYLYGGGFLNPLWGERKLAMLRAAEALLPDAARLSSGMQVDPGWISELSPDDRAALSSFELLGARDEASADALRALGPGPPVLNTGDDAVGILGGLPPRAASPDDDGPLEVNVHVAEHDWVTERPEGMVSFMVAFLGELAARAGRPLRVRPLQAYVDPRVDERLVVERLRAACRERGIETTQPLLLRPASVADLAPELQRATLTVSCSYHAALTSLLLGVPAALLSDNGYYEQKAAGLLRDFCLPAAFSLRSDADPARAASEAWAQLEGDSQLRPRLLAAAEAVRKRRLDAEVELLATIGRTAIGAEGRKAEPMHPRPVEQRAAVAEARAVAAEQKAAEARAVLDSVLRSRSWTLTAPLRRLRGGRGRR